MFVVSVVVFFLLLQEASFTAPPNTSAPRGAQQWQQPPPGIFPGQMRQGPPLPPPGPGQPVSRPPMPPMPPMPPPAHQGMPPNRPPPGPPGPPGPIHIRVLSRTVWLGNLPSDGDEMALNRDISTVFRDYDPSVAVNVSITTHGRRRVPFLRQVPSEGLTKEVAVVVLSAVQDLVVFLARFLHVESQFCSHSTHCCHTTKWLLKVRAPCATYLAL